MTDRSGTGTPEQPPVEGHKSPPTADEIVAAVQRLQDERNRLAVRLEQVTAATLADLLEQNFDTVTDAIMDARGKAPRVRDQDGQPLDRDSGEVLDEVIEKLRAVEATA